MTFIPEREARTVRLPVRINNGIVELIHGGFPKLKEDTVAELLVFADAFQDKRFSKFVSTIRTIKLLPPGAKLYVRLRAKERENIKPPLLPASELPRSKGDSTLSSHFFAPVFVNPEQKTRTVQQHRSEEPICLEIRVRGLKPMTFEPCPIVVPCLDTEAISLNHAYTLLSEAYEPHRKSHTGNAFKNAYFYANDLEIWLPLEYLRNEATAEEESQLQRFLWEQIREAYLPWLD